MKYVCLFRDDLLCFLLVSFNCMPARITGYEVFLFGYRERKGWTDRDEGTKSKFGMIPRHDS